MELTANPALPETMARPVLSALRVLMAGQAPMELLVDVGRRRSGAEGAAGAEGAQGRPER
jgi:hypothetical protein